MVDLKTLKDDSSSVRPLLKPADFHFSASSRDSLRSRLKLLYERGERQQWSATIDLDWSVPGCFGSPLPDDSYFAMASFDRSPLAKYRRPMWDVFRWELQSWMVSQFLPGEQTALTVAARLVEAVPDADARQCLAIQVNDEERHIEVFSRYLKEKVPAPYCVSPSLAALLSDSLNDRRWDVTVLGMQIMVEALAMAAFRLADRTFHDELIKKICRLVARDEARHVSFAVHSLQSVYAEMTREELKYREEFVLEAINLISRRFLMEEIWERIGIHHDDGVRFAKTNELMIKYRQSICAKVVSSLASIGLMSDRLRERLNHLNLLGFSGARVSATSRR